MREFTLDEAELYVSNNGGLIERQMFGFSVYDKFSVKVGIGYEDIEADFKVYRQDEEECKPDISRDELKGMSEEEQIEYIFTVTGKRYFSSDMYFAAERRKKLSESRGEE